LMTKIPWHLFIRVSFFYCSIFKRFINFFCHPCATMGPIVGPVVYPH
jgi:hypothetical protein